MIFFNPRETQIEFRCGGIPCFFEPGESREVEDRIKKHIIRNPDIGLIEYTGSQEVKEVASYATTSWKVLISLASDRGLFKPGMKKVKVIELMEEYDKTRRIIQKPSN